MRCPDGHRFEGWFSSSDAFAAQAAAGAIACAVCGNTQIERAPMAPQVLRRAARRPDDGEAKAGGDAPSASPALAPASGSDLASPQGKAAMVMSALMQQVRALRAKVEATCDYVGDDFPEEARRIHYGEVEERGIYGEATPQEAEALRDEGVEVARIPWLPRDN